MYLTKAAELVSAEYEKQRLVFGEELILLTSLDCSSEVYKRPSKVVRLFSNQFTI